jgi:5-methylcytosine-specific restriction endonuclease McrA
VMKQQSVLAAPDEANAVTTTSTDRSPCLLSSVRPAEVKALAPERYKIQVTVSRETYEKLRRAQDLLRHAVPNGDPAIIVERALGLLVAELERTKLRATSRPRVTCAVNPKSRYIPAAVRRTVWERDGGRCAFSGWQGRCTETGFLEYHHVVPFASGGETSAGNLELRCRAHNQYEAQEWFGKKPPLVRELRPHFGGAGQLAPGRAAGAR